MPKGTGYGNSAQHASTAAGAAGTTVESTGKTAIRKTLTPVFGKRGGKRSTSKRGGRR